MAYFATPSLLTTKHLRFYLRDIVKPWVSTADCTEENGGIKRTNVLYILKEGLLSSCVHSV